MTPFLSDAAAAAMARLTVGNGREPVPEPLDRVRDIRSLVAALENEPAVLRGVRDALDGGATWQQVADAAGLQPAAAKWRWQGTDSEIAERQDSGRKRSARPSSVPTGLPGHSVAEAAEALGLTAQAIYLRVSRGQLRAETIEIADGRRYKRVFLEQTLPDRLAP
ncbi:MAG: hypothetical protein JWO10_2218 [Microbacteriaceae bacterium]|nr:hypothetical protein [Microbacteriaceae bacterium]